ncbi:MAG: cysteine synthase A [Planctomycetia bacterium]|nr:cysteine synthase A [Planctomycetia bacterium]
MKRAKLYNSITETAYNTPLVHLRNISPEGGARILLKLEFFNPLSSVKDRVALAMVEAAEREGILTPNTHIVEPTSGNTGIALAFVAAARKMKITLIMPDSMSMERKLLLKALGAETILTPAASGMAGAVRLAKEMAAADPNVWIPMQFENPANPAVHERTTGPEIWEDCGGDVDIFLTGIGTGGTFTGVTRFLKSRNRHLLALAIEPADSPVLSGGKAGPHGLQGIGAGFIPKNLDFSLVSGVETATTEEAYYWARRLAREEGILAGISTGANLAVASRVAARRENKGKTIVTIAASCGERYLSTPLFSCHDELTMDD